MSLTSCQVHFSPQSEKIVYLSGPLLKSLKLSGKKTIRVKLGNETVAATIKQIQRKGNHLYLSAGVRQSIRVPKAGSVAEIYNVAVVYTNQVQAQPGVLFGGNSMIAAGGNIMAHASTYRIFLRKAGHNSPASRC